MSHGCSGPVTENVLLLQPLTSLLVQLLVVEWLSELRRGLLLANLPLAEGPLVLEISLLLDECLVLELLLLGWLESRPLLTCVGQKVSLVIRLFCLSVSLLLAQRLDEEDVGRLWLGHLLEHGHRLDFLGRNAIFNINCVLRLRSVLRQVSDCCYRLFTLLYNQYRGFLGGGCRGIKAIIMV